METEAIRQWAVQRGYRVGFAPATVVASVRERIERLGAEGAFAPGFAEENLDRFEYPADQHGGGRTVVVVAVPRPAWTVRFETGRGGIDAVLPPTYVEYRRLFEQVRFELVNALGGRVRVDTLNVPLKSLATAAGLTSYGRNNLAYVPEFGSYFQLLAYLLDIPAAGAPSEVRFERMLDRCVTCRACLKACPTGAIGADRFLLHADRCYTLVSESSQPLPAGSLPPSPDCLIGCLKCQEVCPENRGLLERRSAAVSFTPAETTVLLDSGDITDSRLRESIDAKFESLALTEGVPVLRRNLQHLIQLARRPAGNRAAATARPPAGPSRGGRLDLYSR